MPYSSIRENPTQEAARSRVPPPKRYAVVLLNDDYTPMDFVVQVLTEIFRLPQDRAFSVMLLVHETGRGVCGVYQKDIAETRCGQVLAAAQQAGHPLLCVVEEA